MSSQKHWTDDDDKIVLGLYAEYKDQPRKLMNIAENAWPSEDSRKITQTLSKETPLRYSTLLYSTVLYSTVL